ncbi:MAG: helix-turn-helix transcriptional regulator [Tannerella sp.]|jgi:DNA-binding HxlR family transcriptional regulator|nr:helix-turn-helix transcriptional regulator [Tannerella sp.]
MKQFLHEKDCPIRDVISKLGDKWSLLALTSLEANGTLRFSELQKSIGDVSQRMLTVTLRSLEADGFVRRTIYPEVPPRVEYCLTGLGHDLMPHINSLINWALDNMQAIMDSRKSNKRR